jgi:acyl dehydratase
LSLRRIHSDHCRKPLNGGEKFEVVSARHPFDAVGVPAAAETMDETLLVVDGEARRSLLMNRTQADPFPTNPLELHHLPD